MDNLEKLLILLENNNIDPEDAYFLLNVYLQEKWDSEGGTKQDQFQLYMLNRWEQRDYR